MGVSVPNDPINLTTTAGDSWVNYSWEAGTDDWQLLHGEFNKVIHGYRYTGTGSSSPGWTSDSYIKSNLTSDEYMNSVRAFQINDTWYCLLSQAPGAIIGYNWTGRTWQRDHAINSGINGSAGSMPRLDVFEMNDIFYIIIGNHTGDFHGFNWTGSTWQSDNNIINGLTNQGDELKINTFQFDGAGEFHLITGYEVTWYNGFTWNGTGWETNNSLVTNLSGGDDVASDIFTLGGINYIIVGRESPDRWDGYNWTGTTWQSDSAIITGLSGGAESHPTIFNMGEITTNSFNISVNDVWYNNSPAYYNDTGMSPHEWSNITIYGYNSSGDGELSFFSISENSQTANSPITITNTSDWDGARGENVYVDFDATDDDSDPPIFSCNRTDLFTDFNITTGQGNWTSIEGIYTVDFGVSDGYGSTDNYTMTITVNLAPANPVNLANTTAGLWINHTWEDGMGDDDTDSYNVSVNGEWTNGSANTFFNDTYSAHEWQNITVWAYNSTLNNLSVGSISQNTQLLNNNITITNTSDWVGGTGQNVYVDFDATDLDSDTPTFSCNRTDLFTDFNTATGQGNWTAIDGVTYVNFGVSDGYGSIDNYTMSITGDLMPDVPNDLFVTTDDLWINHSWSPGGKWYLLSGETYGVFYGYNWTGTAWQADNAINSSLEDVGSHSTPVTFYMNDTWYLITGMYTGNFAGYNWTGSTWQSDTAIIDGLDDVGQYSKVTVFNMDGTWYLITGENLGTYSGYRWTGTTWESYSTIASGLGDTGQDAAPNVFQKDGTWYLLTNFYGQFIGFTWTGSTWQSDTSIVSGLPDIGADATPNVFQKAGEWYLISGQTDIFYGFNWTGTAWQSDSAIISGLGDPGALFYPFSFYMTTGNITDSYNVSVNGDWTNGTTALFFNDTYSAHEWQNITIYAYNSTGVGSLSENSVSQNTQLSNNDVIITNTSDWTGTASQNVYVDFDSTDLDGDVPIFSCDRTDLFTDFNTTTGQGNWSSATGTYYVDFGVSDGYGSTDNYTMSITANPGPYDPINLTNTTGVDWINHTWEVSDVPADELDYNLIFGTPNSIYFGGYNWSGSTWQSDNSLASGLATSGFIYTSLDTFEIDDEWYTITASLGANPAGFKWDGSTWQSNPAIVSGIGTIGSFESVRLAVFEKYGITYKIYSCSSSGLIGFNWTGSTWQTDTGIVSGLTSESGAAHTVFDIDGTFYCVIGTDSSVIKGFKWTGTTWESNAAIISGITGLTGEITAESLEKDGDHYLIMGSDGNYPSGYKWNGTGWQSNATIVSGIAESDTEGYIYAAYVTGEVAVIPAVTDSYNVSINDVWYNTTTNLFYNDTYSAHSWQNITVYAYNSSAGVLSENSTSQNTQLSNNLITLTDVSVSYSLNEGETFTLDANYTDADNDTAVFTDNASEWNIDSVTGEVSWLTTSGDVGTHSYRVTVDDGYGSTDYVDFTVTVSEVVEVLSTDPADDFEIDVGDAQELSAVLNFNATVIWYVDEIETQTEYNTTTPDYYFAPLEEGEYNVTFIATDPINGTSDSFTWFITVIDEDRETPSVHVPQSRRDRPVTETIERYIPGFWDDYGGVEEVVEEIEEVFTTEIPDKNLWWLVLLLTIILLISYYYNEE